MIKAIKVQLKPNNKQNSQLFGCVGAARWSYNFTLAAIEKHYAETGKFLSDNEIRKSITQIKRMEEFGWLNKYSNNIPKQAVKDACGAYKKFFKHLAEHPKFKSKKRSKPAFYHEGTKLKFTDKHCQIEKLGKVKMSEFGRIPIGEKYSNPRITFDGLDWWVAVGVEVGELTINKEPTQGIGIDLGIKNLAIISTGDVFKNINKSKAIRKAKKKLKRLQRQTSRQYEKSKLKGGRYKKTKNIIKTENRIRKVYARLSGVRNNNLHQITTFLVKTKPEYIVMEDLNVKGMMKNKHLSEAIAEQCWGEFRRQVEYKSGWYGSNFKLADRFYPSSKACNHCGAINRELKLSDRMFVCQECGVVKDRDFNASLNLRDYGKQNTDSIVGNLSLRSVISNESTIRAVRKSDTVKQEKNINF